MAKHKTAETVTNENFGDLLIESVREAVEIHEGRREPAVLRSYPLTARRAAVRGAPAITGAEIRQLRQSLKLSQPVFAAALNVSAATDRAWEQSKRVPEGPSLRLLQIAQRHPAVILEYVAERIARGTRRQSRGRQRSRS
jgi:putative transcriptional regulator